MTFRGSNMMSASTILVIGIFSLCSITGSLAQTSQRRGNVVTFHGNKFEIGNQAGDTLMEVDPQNPDHIIQVVAPHAVPVKMNGKKIYQPEELTSKAELFANWGPFELFVLQGLEDELTKLTDGTYWLYLRNLVIDPHGKVLYYEYTGLYSRNKIPAALKKKIDAKIDPLVHHPLFKPGVFNDNAVLARADIYVNGYQIVVKGHKVSFVKE